MKKLEEILRDKPIKNKLSFAFRIMDILYVVLALVEESFWIGQKICEKVRMFIENSQTIFTVWYNKTMVLPSDVTNADSAEKTLDDPKSAAF